MSSNADLLIEIGTEELPPKALQRLERAFADAVTNAIDAAGLTHGNCSSFATPRRLAIVIEALATEQPIQKINRRGPPVKVAFDKDGKPSRAAEAFAKSCGVNIDELGRETTPKGEWLAFNAEQPGQQASELIADIVTEALGSLPIPKRMRWGAHDAEFVRPAHWIVIMLGKQSIDATILGLKTAAVTRGHRFHAPNPIAINDPADYRELLRDPGRVIADFSERRQRIIEIAIEAATGIGGEAVLNPDVVDEVTALVEWPVSIQGRFDEQFLKLPEEVLISTLQDHQRYFPVRNKAGGLLPNFIAISNIESLDPNQVRLGNERVVRPRLADGAFFWDQDCRRTLESRREQLKDIVFQRKLGSVFEKSHRVAILAESLTAITGANKADTIRAADLAKTDLLTEMVGEFPELQGRMGYHYALHDGENEAVANAIEEQYWPRHSGDKLPETSVGRVLALADRIDTIAGIFSIGQRPTGNKDPFGLRRAALGVLRILIEQKIDIDLQASLQRAIDAQPKQPSKSGDKHSIESVAGLYDFFLDRLRGYYLDGLAPGFDAGEITAEIFESVRIRAPQSPLDFHQRLAAVHQFLNMDAAASLAAANKRIANILRGSDETEIGAINPALFVEPAEQKLFDAVAKLLPSHEAGLVDRNYPAVLERLATLREPVDEFFDGVMVMSDDPGQRQNRLALLAQLRRLFLDIADLSGIPASGR